MVCGRYEVKEEGEEYGYGVWWEFVCSEVSEVNEVRCGSIGLLKQCKGKQQ